jgi:transcriptional regulator with XRE-family HTH domain
MENEQLNEVQDRIAQLQEKGWTLAAIADELEVTTNAVEKWKAGDRNPSNQKATLAFLDKLLERKRIPKKRRYQKKGVALYGEEFKATQ